MCSISTNATVDKILGELERSDDRKMIEKRLFEFAKDANVNQSGGLDNPAWIMKRMPDDLKGIRKITIGRHRVYFTGHHKNCSYQAFYIKPFKKTGVQDEDDPKHQRKLSGALIEPSKRIIAGPDEPGSSADE